MWLNYYNPMYWEEKDGVVTITARIPGTKPEDIDVSIQGSVLSIDVPENEHTAAIKREMKFAHGLEEKQVTTKYEHGILTVTINQPEGYRKRLSIG